ncbi:MAG: sensor histidine kinase [Synergistaceae bacterium]|nr:sensor histidine kinase [Synergistaceae bacterium]
MKKNLLLILMIVVTLLTVAGFLLSLHTYRAQEEAMDSMMRSYVLDLADSFSNSAAFMGRAHSMRQRMPKPMRLRMLSMDPGLNKGESGGILLIGPDGKILGGSPGAEKILPLRRNVLFSDEPVKVRDEEGNDYHVVLRELEDGNFILAAVSRTALLAPLTGIWRFWILTAMGTSAAVFMGMLLLWRYLAVPLRGIAEKLRTIRWGKDPSVVLYSGPLSELEALSGVIGNLAEEAFAKEELKKRYVTDIVRAEEETRRHLARELHDGPLQSSVAAIKRIQMAREILPGDAGRDLREHLNTAEEVVQVAAREIRDYCDELSPSWIRLGFVSTLEENASRLSQAYGAAIHTEAEETLDSLPEEYALALIRIFQEAVSNSVRHGQASSIRATLRREGDSVRFTLEDDGAGFEAHSLSEREYEALRTTGHRGLANMNERVRLLKGTMTLESHPGEGCRIDILFPLPGE